MPFDLNDPTLPENVRAWLEFDRDCDLLSR